VRTIREALSWYPSLSVNPGTPAPTLDRVTRQLRYVDQAWLSSHFTVVVRIALTMHEHAHATAQKLGPHYQTHHTVFGPVNVALHRVAALVRLHEPGQALEYAQKIEPRSISVLPPERRVTYMLDLATAYTETGQYADAARTLVDAERVAPEEVRCRPLAHATPRDAALHHRRARTLSTADSVTGRRHSMNRVLYLFVCGAGPASRITDMVTLAQAEGWSVYCVATPAAVEHFLDVPAPENATSHPVRTTYREPGDEPLPKADGVIVGRPPTTRSTSGQPAYQTPTP
jgi:hypothetical protein